MCSIILRAKSIASHAFVSYWCCAWRHLLLLGDIHRWGPYQACLSLSLRAWSVVIGVVDPPWALEDQWLTDCVWEGYPPFYPYASRRPRLKGRLHRKHPIVIT